MGCLKLSYYPTTELKIISDRKVLTYNKTEINNRSSYLFGFNGKEKINEQYGEGNAYDFGARMYDPRICRWQAVDLKAGKLPDQSPYSFSYNAPIIYKDPDGKYPIIVITGEVTGYTISRVYGYGSQVSAIVVPTYRAIIYDVANDGTKTVMGYYNVTRDGWTSFGSNNSTTHLVNLSTEPIGNETTVKANKYNSSTSGKTVQLNNFSAARKPENDTYDDGTPIDSEIRRSDPDVARNVQIHAGGFYENNGVPRIAGTYGCFGVVDGSQVASTVSQAAAFLKKAEQVIAKGTDVPTDVIQPSNQKILDIYSDIDKAKSNAKNRGESDTQTRVTIQKRDYSKEKNVPNSTN